MRVHKLVSGFKKPIDVLIQDSLIYVLDMGNSNGSGRKIYAISFKDTSTVNTTPIDQFDKNQDRAWLIPNPTLGKVEIQVDDFSSIEQVLVYDLSGKLYQIVENSGNVLDLSALPAQVYLVEIRLKNGKKMVKKLKKE